MAADYPKDLYKGNVETFDCLTVNDAKEEGVAIKKGWKTDTDFFAEWRNRHTKKDD